MNSKISFRRLLGEDIRHRSRLIVFFAILGFCTYPLILWLALSNELRAMNALADTEALLHLENGLIYASRFLLGTENLWSYIFIAFAAVLTAVTGMSHLYSTEKTDFFHSLGVKRHKLFLSKWISGMIVFLVPFIANLIFALFAVVPLNGGLYPEVTYTALTALGIFCLGFTALFTSCMLACVLTGRVVVTLIVFFMICVYAPLFKLSLNRILSQSYPAVFFPNVNVSYGELFSPAGALVRAGYSVADQAPTGGLGSGIAAMLIWIGAAFALGMIVYRFRPSEAAGRAMSFSVMKTIVKIASGIVISIAAGALLSNMFNYSFSGGWFWTGAVISVVLVQIVLETVFNKEFAAVIKNWRSFVVMLGCLAAAVILLTADPFRVNVWSPARDDVSGMSVSYAVYTYGGFKFDHYEPTNYTVDWKFGAFNTAPYNMKSELDKKMLSEYEMLYKLTAEKGSSSKGEWDEGSENMYIVGYELKDGSKKYRKYILDNEEIERVLDEMSATQEFKEKYYPAFRYDFSGLKKLRLESFRSNGDFDIVKNAELSDKELEEFISCYKSDVSGLKLSDLDDKESELTVSLTEYDPPGTVVYDGLPLEEEGIAFDGGNTRGASIYIYPGMEKTIEFLSKVTGLDVRGMVE